MKVRNHFSEMASLFPSSQDTIAFLLILPVRRVAPVTYTIHLPPGLTYLLSVSANLLSSLKKIACVYLSATRGKFLVACRKIAYMIFRARPLCFPHCSPHSSASYSMPGREMKMNTVKANRAYSLRKEALPSRTNCTKAYGCFKEEVLV